MPFYTNARSFVMAAPSISPVESNFLSLRHAGRRQLVAGEGILRHFILWRRVQLDPCIIPTAITILPSPRIVSYGQANGEKQPRIQVKRIHILEDVGVGLHPVEILDTTKSAFFVSMCVVLTCATRSQQKRLQIFKRIRFPTFAFFIRI